MSKQNIATTGFGWRLFAVLGLVAGLAACGGGGGVGGAAGGVALPTALVTITPQNAPQVAGAAIDALFSGAFIQLPLGVQIVEPPPASPAISTVKSIARIAQTAAQKIVSHGGAPAMVTGVTNSENCAVSGTLSFNETSPGSVLVTFNDCSDIVGERINGTMSISDVVDTDSTNAFKAVMNLTLTRTSPPGTQTIIGDMHFSLNTAAFELTLSGSSLSTGNSNPAVGNSGLKNYTIIVDSSGNFTAMNFGFASTLINGTASFSTTAPFVFGSGVFPAFGAATISGANSTLLQMTILGDEGAAAGSQVRLELSTDGGATYAPPTYVTWGSISSAI